MNASIRRATARVLAVVLASSFAFPSALVAIEGTALAQGKTPGVRDSLPKEALPDWDAGMEILKRPRLEASDYDTVRAAFKRAYNRSKNPRVLYNVAVAEKELGNYVEAMEALEQELEEAKKLPPGDKGAISAEEEAKVRAAIKSIEPYVMKVTIEVNEPGATVYVDTKEIGVSPLKTAVRLKAASHRIRAVKPGYVEAVQTILGDKPETTVGLKLESMVRTSRVTVSVVGPRSAVVKIDGREVGAATAGQPYVGQVGVSAEPHAISAEAPDFVTATQSVVVRDGEPVAIALQLAPEQKKGKLLVVTEPAEASIEIDGKLVGASRWEGPVEAGKHQVAVKKRGFYAWSYDVEVPKGTERSVNARLNEDRNTSFVPYLIGTIVVIGAGSLASYFILKPKDEDKAATTLAPFNVPTPPAAIRF